MRKKAIFLDRDGTINVDFGYVHEIENFQFIEGAIEACEILQKMGFELIIVTNQSGIGRKIFSEEQFLSLTEWMDWSFADRNVDIAAVYYCPHLPEENCNCRKPKPGMVFSAKNEFDLDLENSWIVGDKIDDLLTGKNAKIGKKVLVKSGKPITKEAENLADFVIESIKNLPDLIKNQ